MLDEARRRTESLPAVELCQGDVHALPVEPDTVDRAKVDRVLMHIEGAVGRAGTTPPGAPAGARVALAGPDWDTLVVDAEDLEVSRAFTRFTTSEVVLRVVNGPHWRAASATDDGEVPGIGHTGGSFGCGSRALRPTSAMIVRTGRRTWRRIGA
ncbi:hypothetical protein [Streptomyces silvisoli]|uniref:Uncharacterized protein n=1 Tax=Streptomyces silvisoli TaxID=3034235 RepID=A0ABT5ZVR9_9ACTN|nr:hypothetical protein [Streptomyces silvisoli]MDF3293923.1 hypothetical protein [Streptomyces silvisoli]